jgi:hypothetical protein
MKLLLRPLHERGLTDWINQWMSGADVPHVIFGHATGAKYMPVANTCAYAI